VNIIDKTKRILLSSAENLLFMVVRRAPFGIALFVAWIMRKALFREKIIEKKNLKIIKSIKLLLRFQ
jgi:hypothetical protein